ncbi:hypothetical protein Btru_064469 [Bulinus truncatus]|nr:hypothetical protein Btru_064469 [Bulinus truncatus]
MDEKEQADRMAAAEALFMISTRVDKSGSVIKTSKRGRKKKNIIIDEVEEKRQDNNFEALNVSRRGRGRRGGGQSQRGSNHSNSKRGRGGKTNISTRGRGTGRGKKHIHEDAIYKSDSADSHFDSHTNFNDSMSVSNFETIVTQEKTKKKVKTKSSKVKEQRKSSQSSSSSSKSPVGAGLVQEEPISHQAIGFTGATISIPEHPIRRASVETSQNVSGPLSALKQQLNLNSKNYGGSIPLQSLAPMNLLSFPSEIANLPSIPLELESLRLSSQPTPNLSSLGDPNLEGVMDYEESACDDREKSEKFLPLKKRKLHNPAPSANVVAHIPKMSMESSPDSDQEEAYEAMSPAAERSEPSTPPVRSSFTVQAPPIITMQTLMEIKTALTADEDGDLPLHIAVVHENMRMVIKLINLMRIAGKGVDKFNKQQQTPLHLAVKLDFLEAVDILLKSGANVNSVDCTGSSAIHMAVQGRSTKCLQMLLDRCSYAELNARNFDGLTPLHTAVDNGDLDQVELLLKYGADIDVTDGKSGRTCLFRAAENNEKAMVELLLRHGANPEVPNYAGVTTAMAVQGRNLHGVLKLLGSVPTDKLSEVEAKPFGAESAMFSGQQVESIPPAKENNLYKHSPERKEKPDTPNETKVFQNVFVVSQKNDVETDGESGLCLVRCRSEPSSPDVKMEVHDDTDQDTSKSHGLLSLPEGIFHRAEGKQMEGTAEYSHRLVRKMELPLAKESVGQLCSIDDEAAKTVADTRSLTSNQARLYQKLLELYNVDEAGTSVSSPLSKTSSSSTIGLFSSSALHGSVLSGSYAKEDEQATAGKKTPEVTTLTSVRNPGLFSNSILSQRIDHNGHPASSLHSTSQPIKVEISSNASPPDTPLNLSKPVLKPSEKSDSGDSLRAGVVQKQKSLQKGTVLSIGVRLSSSEKSPDSPEISGGQYEMVLVPASSQQITVHPKIGNISTLARDSNTPSSSPPSSHQGNEGSSTTKLVSQKTASLVRDFLIKQQRSSSPLTAPASTSSETLPLASSVLTSVPISQDLIGLNQARHIITVNRTLVNAVPAERTYSEGFGTTVSKLRSNTASTTFGTFPQQNVKTFLTSPILIPKKNVDFNQKQNSEPSQGKIVGFSGAILSIAPQKKERLEQYISEKTEPKSKEILPKEFQKKRGRKPGKISQDLVAVSEVAGLSKIHSDTDERLRQFLGAKKNDGLPSVLEDVDRKSNSDISIQPQTDSTYRTVGIFSGDIQHVRIGKTYSPSSFTQSSSSSTAAGSKSLI